MRRISLAVALLGAIAGAGCSPGNGPSSSGSSKGVPGSTFTVDVRGAYVDPEGSPTTFFVKGGKVTSTPAGIDCGEVGGTVTSACSADFAWGTAVTLSVAYDTDYVYVGFAGSCSGTACSLSGNADKMVMVRFFKSGERTGHPNFSVGTVHASAYNDWQTSQPGAYACTDCHGATLLGQGIAPSCGQCHAVPGTGPGAVTVPPGGVAGVVYSKAGPVVGAKVHLVPTGDVLADSIYTPPEYGDTVTYGIGQLASYHEGVYQKLTAAGPGTAPSTELGTSTADWQFIAAVHTPHGYSNRNSYKADSLVLVANKQPSAWAAATAYRVGQEVRTGTIGTDAKAYRCVTAGTSGAAPGPTGTGAGIVDGTAAWDYLGDLTSTTTDAAGATVSTVFGLYEATRDQRGSSDTSNAPWSAITTLVIDPPTTATGDNVAWKFIGAAGSIAYFDNLPQWAAKTYVAGALVRDGGSVYRTAAGGTSNGTTRATDTNLAWTSLGGLKNLAIASNVDEPLEGTIRQHAYALPATATTDSAGMYSFAAADLPASWTGKYYVTVLPAAGDTVNLAGGDRCRTPMATASLVDQQVNIRVATTPGASASYVGPSRCLTCHSKHNAKKTLHSLGIRKAFAPPSLIQDASRFPDWYTVTQSKFSAGDATSGGTILYYYGVNAALDSWSVSELDPSATSSVSYTARLYGNGGKYYVELNNIKNPADPRSGSDYEVELSYGGGLYKQRFITKVKADGSPGGAADATSRFIIPIQFNFEGVPAASQSTVGSGRWMWQHYNGKDWLADNADPALATIKNIATANPHKSFDSMCAGCHFTGYSLDTVANRASAVADTYGDYDYDGDGQAEVMNVTCESCHGPGSEHVAAGSNSAKIVNPALLTPEREVAICSQCHTRFTGLGGVGASVTEAPLSAGHKMPRPGISRKDFLQNHVNKMDDGVWDAKKGNGKYSVKHHQQASDFLTTEKYRNKGIPLGGYSVVAGKAGLNTCSSCHDLHGDGDPLATHQLIKPLDVRTSSGTTAGLCTTCHSKSLGGTGHTDRGSAAPYTAGTANHSDAATIGWSCASCHVTKTAKSGAGALGTTLGGETFYRGDISSHLFIGVPYVYYSAPAKLPSSAKSGGTDGAGKVDIMPMPLTNSCAGTCHTAPRSQWKNGIQ